MTAESIPGRAIWRLTGKDVVTFLQGLVTNDVAPLGRGPGIVWAAFLTPQGKYLADFFIVRRAADGDDPPVCTSRAAPQRPPPMP